MKTTRLGAALVAAVAMTFGWWATPAGAEGAQIIHREAFCSVGFDADDAFDEACDVINVHQPDGGYTLVIHGQVQPHDMERFLASGVRHYSAEWSAGECFAAYLFVVDEGHAPVWSDSVRHFTPDGRMTETCHYRPSSDPAAVRAGVNPFVGSWESVDPDPDNSHVRLQIGATGNWHLRDEQGSVCLNNGFGFVPATAQGTGEFTSADTYEARDGDIYCYPRDGRGRQYVLTAAGGDYAYWPESDVIIDQFGTCWWRTGTGSPSACPVE